MEFFRAEDETRTRDPNLGKVVLYQLSYFRILLKNYHRCIALGVQIYAGFRQNKTLFQKKIVVMF